MSKSFASYYVRKRPYLEYACAVWAPHTARDNDLLESVQNRAARFLGSDCFSVVLSLLQFVLENWGGLLSKCAVTIFPCGHSIVSYIKPLPLIFHFNTLATRSHSLTLNLLYSTINAFRYSFFMASPMLWNSIPFDVLSQPAASTFKHKLKHFLFCI